jgi:hypothetical protein
MSRVVRATSTVLVVGALLALPGPVAADNCSDLGDCFGLIEAAALALLAMAIFAFLFFNPALLLAAAGLLESLLFTPMGWITGWGRAGAASLGASMTEAELLALRSRLIMEDLRVLGAAAFNSTGSATNCFGVSNAVLGWASTGTATSALPAFPMTFGSAAATLNTPLLPATFETVATGLASEGAGAQGVIAVLDSAAGVGHYFAGMNVNGAVIFADMQASAVVSANAAEVAAAAGYQGSEILVFFLGL